MKNKFSPLFISIFLMLAVTLNACASANDPVVFAAPGHDATPSTLSALLSEITGKVETRQADQDAFWPAQFNPYLNINGQALTGSDGRVRLDLSTGTIIRVAPNSLFTLAANEPSEGSLKTKLELAIGKLFIILSGGSMEVETPTGTAAVRGSYMSVDYDANSGEIRITCLEGNCSLSSAGGRVDITAGQTAVITGPGQPPQIGEMSDQDIQDWLDHNPEATLVVAALTGTSTPPAPAPTATVPPTAFAPTKVVDTVPMVIAPVIEEVVDEEDPQPTAVPTSPSPPSLVPTVEINNIVPAAAVVGQPLTIYVTVLPSPGGPIPTGTIKVLVNGSALCSATLGSSGSASCVCSIPVSGAASLTAEYLGDSKYLTAQSAAYTGYVVTQASTTTTIVSHTPNPSVVGAAVTFTAVVDVVVPGSGTPYGSVTFSNGTDSCTVTSAPWSCNISFTATGTQDVIATYSGDTNFINSASSYVYHDVLASAISEFRNVTFPVSPIVACNQTYRVDVLDVDGVNEVKVEYRMMDNNFVATDNKVLLSRIGSTDTWEGTFSTSAAYPSTVYWRFIAIDGASNLTFFDGVAPYTSGYGGPSGSYAFGHDMIVTSCP